MELTRFASFLPFMRRANKPCLHPHLLFDTYREVILAKCSICGELWLSSDIDPSVLEAHGASEHLVGALPDPNLRP